MHSKKKMRMGLNKLWSSSEKRDSNSQTSGSTRKVKGTDGKKESNIAKRYDILMTRRYELGRGSFSDVRTAVSKNSGKHVAMKMVKKKYLMDSEEKVMVLREIEFQKQIRHPGVVRLFEVFEDTNYFYLVLEKTNHGNLAQFLANKPMVEEQEAIFVFQQIVSAVHFLHSKNVLHGDLKPENILLHADIPERKSLSQSLRNISKHLSIGKEHKPKEEEDSEFAPTYDYDYDIPIEALEVKLCDFGLSRKLKSDQYRKSTGDPNLVPYTEFRGTMGYVAPEILKEQCCSSPSDVWSLGIILYEILGCGTKPFVPYRDCLTVDVEFPEVLWSKRTSESKRLIREMLCTEPQDRISTTDIMESPWFTLGKI